jgi:hypothetical protein
MQGISQRQGTLFCPPTTTPGTQTVSSSKFSPAQLESVSRFIRNEIPPDASDRAIAALISRFAQYLNDRREFVLKLLSHGQNTSGGIGLAAGKRKNPDQNCPDPQLPDRQS